MEYGYLSSAKKLRLVFRPALLWAWPVLRLVTFASVSITAMSAPAFAQGNASTRVETVVVTGSRSASAACSLQLLNTVPMQISNNVMTVQADVNGKTGSFQFGTGAFANQMTDAAARALGLIPGNTGVSRTLTGSVSPVLASSYNLGPGKPMYGAGVMGVANSADPAPAEIYDSKGRAYTNIITVADFSMQSVLTKDVEFHITPLPPPGVDGVLSTDFFHRFDIDLNFAAGRLNFFSQDHCRGGVLYWRAPGVAALPFVTRDNRIIARVMLEGKELTAVIDTGSSISAVRFEAAARLFGITPGGPGLTLAGEHHADPRQDIYAYSFKTLSFGGVAIVNPNLVLTQDVLVQGANPNANTGSRVLNDAAEAQPDMIIGMDLLKLTHLYIALHERVLYLTQGPELASSDPGAQPVVPVTPFRP
jgi:hypothetical protein